MQDSTFPKVMFGDAGNIQSGYGVNALSGAARGRINPFRENLEMSLQYANEIIFSCVEEFGGSKGVSVWGKDAATNSTYRVTLNKKDIGGQYDNLVTLEPLVPQDTMQKETLGIRKVEMGILSRQTYRDKINAEVLPPDEQLRVDFEKVMDTPEMMPKKAVEILRKKFPDNWLEVVAGTQFEAAVIEAGLAHKMPDGTLMEGTMPAPPAPPAPAPMPPMLPPQGMMPPQPPQMPPLGTTGMPGAMQPPGLNNGLGGGLPPQLQGQVTPDMLGLPQQGDPLLFQQMINGGLPPAEELAALQGRPR
jgi:hypothetical protein